MHGRLLDADDVAAVSSMGRIGTTHRPNGERTQNVIDYTLATRDIVVVSRTQVKGVADRDLISYEIVVNDDATFLKGPRRAKLQPVPVSQDWWVAHWGPNQPVFETCLERCDSCGAWKILSYVAGQCLGASEKAPSRRHEQSVPQMVQNRDRFERSPVECSVL